jgi:hypothetical protein
VIPGFLNFLERHQVGGFQETAKILLADVMEGSFAGGEALDGLVFHLQAFQVQDAQVFVAAFPDLILLQLHGQHYTNRVRALAIRLLWKKRPEFPPDRPMATRPVSVSGTIDRDDWVDGVGVAGGISPVWLEQKSLSAPFNRRIGMA